MVFAAALFLVAGAFVSVILRTFGAAPGGRNQLAIEGISGLLVVAGLLLLAIGASCKALAGAL